MLLVRVAAEKALSFEPMTPNRETIETIKAARRGDLVTAGSPDAPAHLDAGAYAGEPAGNVLV